MCHVQHQVHDVVNSSSHDHKYLEELRKMPTCKTFRKDKQHNSKTWHILVKYHTSSTTIEREQLV